MGFIIPPTSNTNRGDYTEYKEVKIQRAKAKYIFNLSKLSMHVLQNYQKWVEANSETLMDALVQEEQSLEQTKTAMEAELEAQKAFSEYQDFLEAAKDSLDEDIRQMIKEDIKSMAPKFGQQ